MEFTWGNLIVLKISNNVIILHIYMYLTQVSAKKNEFKNYFQNPYDSSRNIFVFSDAPHLLKTVRNRLHKNKQFKVMQNYSTNI